jgi:dTMP kinase
MAASEDKRGMFVTFEGIDGAGKSTQIEWAATWLRERVSELVVTREPGGTPLGEALRKLLLSPGRRMHPEAEALLMFASRREHIAEIIEPALARGALVMCDRFADASFAYQGGGRGVEWERLLSLEQWVQGDLQPDLTVFFDVPVDVAQKRLAAVKVADRFEQEKAAFFERVRAGYLRRADEAPARFVTIDATQRPAAVRKTLQRLLQERCLIPN